MKKTTLAILCGLALAACGQDATAPSDGSEAALTDVAELAFHSSVAGDPSSLLPNLHRFPDHLKLTDAQTAQIRALLQQFATDTHADRDALAAILREARAAHQAGKSRGEIRAILEQGEPIRQRLLAAEQKLRADVLALLTPEQRAWLESHQPPRRCSGQSLSESQRTEISALIAAFEHANSADLAAIRDALERARAARANGASREDIKAILETVKAAMERVRAARIELAKDISALLTPEQRASGCYLPRGPRG
ncbi:MAG: Spy/CpxP family protein refolding chaperone [Gemmatimonadota bacterium]